MFYFAAYGLSALSKSYQSWLNSLNLEPDDRLMLTRVIGLVVLGVISWLATKIVRWVLVRVLERVIPREHSRVLSLMYNAKVLRKAAALTPVIVILGLESTLFPSDVLIRNMLQTLVEVYVVAVLVWIGNAGLSAVYDQYRDTEVAGHVALQAFIQAIKLLLVLAGFLLALSLVVGQSPIYFLSGLGAATAVLLLIFKDVILGLVAGIQINVNNMVRIGDWIQMDQQNANGTVIEISLTNVKVSNFDKTVTSVPTYALISESFINWRGMFDAGGRRIKQSLHLDMRTIEYASDDLISQLKGVKLFHGWLQQRLDEIKSDNSKGGFDPVKDTLDGRRLTNVGLFRHYTVEYLKKNPKVFTDGSFIFLVRYLEAEGQGLPMQIYVFTKTTVWAEYEEIMSDIFEHLYATAPLFGLQIYQSPSGNDLASLEGAPAATATVLSTASGGQKP